MVEWFAGPYNISSSTSRTHLFSFDEWPRFSYVFLSIL